MTKTAIIGLVCVSLFIVAPSWAANLESPAQGATLSGIGFISGWKCDAGNITVRINDGGPIPVAGDQPRADTRIACGTINNGFITQINWALLGDGEHTVVAYDDGVKFAASVFTVVTAGEPYLPDAEGMCVVPDFPAPGENASFAWNTSTQHLELTDVGSHITPPDSSTAALERFVGLWQADWRYTSEGCTHHPSFTTTYPFYLTTVEELDTSNGLYIVVPSGHTEGSFPLEPGGDRAFSISGVYETTTAAGTWFNVKGCGGTWTARKIDEDPFATAPEPEPEADPRVAQLRKLFGTWRISYGPNAYDTWTFSKIDAWDDGTPALPGTFDSNDRIEWVVVWVADDTPDYTYGSRYLDIHDDEFSYGTCEYLWFSLTSPTRLQGRSYGSVLNRDGTCEPLQRQAGLPVTGERIRAYQGAALSLQDEAGGWVVYGVMDDDLAPLGGAPRE